MTSGVRDLIVVGAGVAGLAAARRVKDAGGDPLVLNGGRGLGGRCATWRLDGQPVDYGVAFLHGSDELFLRAIQSVPDMTLIPGWPRRIHGEGTPCQPHAFAPTSTRLAYAEGLSVFPRWLGRDIEVRHEATVESLAVAEGGFTLGLRSGEHARARDLVLAVAGPQAEQLLAPLEGVSAEVDGARRLLAMFGSLPCLTLMAAYDAGTPPPWEIHYPDDSQVLQVIAHDSSKRLGPVATTLVLQAHPRWSRARLDERPETWGRALLDEAGRHVGAWAARPRTTRAHVWRCARVDSGSELRRPLLISLESGARLGIAGELFAPGGGVEAAWLSGHRLAGRMLGESEP